MKRLIGPFTLVALAMSIPVAVLAEGTSSAAQQPSNAAVTSGAHKQSTNTTTETSAPAHHRSHAMKAGAQKSREPKMDLNTATKEELMKLPGMDDATADQIIAGRPFKSKSDLLAKKVVTKAEYSKISSRVMAKPAPAQK